MVNNFKKPFNPKIWLKLGKTFGAKHFPPNHSPKTDSNEFRNDLVEIGGVSPQITADKMG